MRILIIGCGYVGLPLGSELLRQGHEVHGLRRSPAGELPAAGIKPIIADITRPDSLGQFSPAYDWVVHCVSSGGGDTEAYRRLYLKGTRTVLKWLSAGSVQKLVYTSSTSVYGQTDGSWVDEGSPTEPVAETARILVETERLLLDEKKVPAVILRLAGIYGPGRGYWLKQFITGQARLEGKGERFLNLIHRDDVVGAALAALTRGQPGAIYNVVDNEPVTQRGCFEWLAQRLNRELPPTAAAPEGPARKRGVTNKRVANGRLRRELGYDCKYPTFREGFEAELVRNA